MTEQNSSDLMIPSIEDIDMIVFDVDGTLMDRDGTVSYTHLTLPTIYSV